MTDQLRPWLRHKVWCNVKTDDPPDTERCKCGLAAALATPSPNLDATPSPDADLRAAVTASPWSFKEGTLRERLEWAREQHQRAAEATDLEAERAISPTWASLDTFTSWHRACADWYAGMVRDLDAAAATPSPDTLDKQRALAELDTIDSEVDNTHPEGDGCPLCVALDNLRAILEGEATND